MTARPVFAIELLMFPISEWFLFVLLFLFCLLSEIRYQEYEHVNGYVGFQLDFFLNKESYQL